MKVKARKVALNPAEFSSAEEDETDSEEPPKRTRSKIEKSLMTSENQSSTVEAINQPTRNICDIEGLGSKSTSVENKLVRAKTLYFKKENKSHRSRYTQHN